MIHHPKWFGISQQIKRLTSHVDVLPTLLGLAGINPQQAQSQMQVNHTEVHPLVGRNLSPLLEGRNRLMHTDEPLYFMTEDDVTKGLHQVNSRGEPYESVTQPNSIEAVITTLPTDIWKLARYYDATKRFSREWVTVADEWEMYNLSADPFEEQNLAYPPLLSPENMVIKEQLLQILVKQRREKRLTPAHTSHASFDITT
ncbi:hypothetical protein [Polycladospora coralii]|uniref:hypothetical protein n=1 Tax=Polycladospora coralii TaxID=2771432 RepID=UPI0034E1A996